MVLMSALSAHLIVGAQEETPLLLALSVQYLQEVHALSRLAMDVLLTIGEL